MRFSRLELKNWRNFVSVDLPIGERLFLTGPNASGKSNLLDAFRFLRDLAKDGGGLQAALRDRGGLSRLRCLAARRDPIVEVGVTLEGANGDGKVFWRYEVGLTQEPRGAHRTLLKHERVWKDGILLLERPDDADRRDQERLTQTHLEQIASNLAFRPVADAFKKTLYLHLVPQLLKYPSLANREATTEDPFGLKFLDRVMATPEKTRRKRLAKIEEALRVAVPEFQDLTDVRDDQGVPHLEVLYKHWRIHGGRQREDQFSDGTLRLIGLLWALLESDALLLLEEPELSLHTAIVSRLPALIWRMQQSRQASRQCQVILSTHSTDLLSDRGIRSSQVALLRPQGSEGTVVEVAANKREIELLLEQGMSIGEAVLPLTAPSDAAQLSLFK
jgi:predicted ATPase